MYVYAQRTNDKESISILKWHFFIIQIMRNRCLLSMLGTAIILGSHAHPLLRSNVVGTLVEGIILAVVLVLSIIICAIASGPAKGLSVDEFGAVRNGNIYYFSWFAFLNNLYLASCYVKSVHKIDITQRCRDISSASSSPATFVYWFMLLLSSVIVMSTSISLGMKNCTADDGEEKVQPYCSRTILGIIVGAIATILSSTTLAMMNHLSTMTLPFLGEVGRVGLLFILYCFEVAYVTDGSGPGAPLGNLYYSSWISLLLTMKIGFECYDAYVQVQDATGENANIDMNNIQMHGRNDGISGMSGSNAAMEDKVSEQSIGSGVGRPGKYLKVPKSATTETGDKEVNVHNDECRDDDTHDMV